MARVPATGSSGAAACGGATPVSHSRESAIGNQDRIGSTAVRVYYEDTDAAGIVYYAGYLRFLERGRTEFLRALGHGQQRLMEAGVAFAVRSISADYLKPARLDDLLSVDTGIESLGRAQVVFAQRVRRDRELLLDAKIRIACIDPARGRPHGMPRALHAQLSALLGPAP